MAFGYSQIKALVFYTYAVFSPMSPTRKRIPIPGSIDRFQWTLAQTSLFSIVRQFSLTLLYKNDFNWVSSLNLIFTSLFTVPLFPTRLRISISGFIRPTSLVFDHSLFFDCLHIFSYTIHRREGGGGDLFNQRSKGLFFTEFHLFNLIYDFLYILRLMLNILSIKFYKQGTVRWRLIWKQVCLNILGVTRKVYAAS